MASTWREAQFPQFETGIRQLVERHKQLDAEPLHLALAFAPERDPQDIFLLEVVGGGDESVSSDKELFETTFEPNTSHPTGFQQRVHLVLSNPTEIEAALEQKWPSAEEISNAVLSDNFHILLADDIGERIFGLMKVQTCRHEGAARG